MSRPTLAIILDTRYAGILRVLYAPPALRFAMQSASTRVRCFVHALIANPNLRTCSRRAILENRRRTGCASGSDLQKRISASILKTTTAAHAA
jgi:hypothetical protein